MLEEGHGGAAQEEQWVAPRPAWSARRMSQGCDHTTPQKACGTPYRYTDTFGYVVAEAMNATHARFATAMVDQCIAETREFHQPPDTIGTVMMRHVHSLSWDNDRVQDDLITWQIAKDNSNKPIRNGGAKGFKKAIATLEEQGLG